MATYKNANVKETDFEAKGYTPAQIESMRKSQKVAAVTSMGLRFNKSLRNYPCHNFDFYIMLFNQFDAHGTLPFEGSLADQPNHIIEVFNILKGLSQEAQANVMKQQEQSNKKRK